ncbi:MAG: hypothetical protein OXI96_06060 [Acidimicrobiaceae bacterium]|nr:hypothetical protein [Acidimicrobiaceae bacterium]
MTLLFLGSGEVTDPDNQWHDPALQLLGVTVRCGVDRTVVMCTAPLKGWKPSGTQYGLWSGQNRGHVHCLPL